MRLEIEVGGKSQKACDILSHAEELRVDSLDDERKQWFLSKGVTYMCFRMMIWGFMEDKWEAERTAVVQ